METDQQGVLQTTSFGMQWEEKGGAKWPEEEQM